MAASRLGAGERIAGNSAVVLLVGWQILAFVGLLAPARIAYGGWRTLQANAPRRP